jgi:hypothetical protein
MRITMRKTSLLAALFLGTTGIVATAQIPPADPRLAVPTRQQEKPKPLPGLTDRLGLDEPKISELLGDVFESPVAGLSFQPPANCKPTRSNEADHIVEYSNDDRHWLLKVTRARLAQPMPLQSIDVKDRVGEAADLKGALTKKIGLLDYTINDFMKGHPQADVVRHEIVNVGEYGVGLAFFRLNVGSERFLRQQAFFQVNEQLYYVFTLTTPSPKTGDPGADPDERLAARTFMAMLDTIQLLDRSWIKTDQVNRLFRTRALFTDWNDKGGKRLKEALVPEQWLRILRNGKDVGYTYQAEEFVEGRNVKNNPGRLRDGILVSVRTRTMDGNNQLDLGTQMFTSLDRKHEDWAQITNVVTGKGTPAEEKAQNMEFGFSEIHVTHVLDRGAVRDPKFNPKDEKDPNLSDVRNPILRDVEAYTLAVDRATQGRNANNKSEKHQPSPWYIPQAVGSMLPRLLPLNRPVTYLFQSYVSDQHEPILRYVDVGFEKEVTFNGKKVRAIAISDRIRIDGNPIIHYMSPEGVYLGSVNDELKLTIVPTDEATLKKIWINPDLTRPQIERPESTGVR